MAAKKAAVKFTANFEQNLTAIEAFCVEADTPQSYDSLLDLLLDTVIPDLEHFPEIGRSFLTRAADSVEARTLSERLKARIGDGEIREYLFDEYLILYALTSASVYLLSIRHHKQL